MPDQADLAAIFRVHRQRYPGMKTQDLIKLVYQNEFAGGHLATNAAESLQRLKDEVAAPEEAIEHAACDVTSVGGSGGDVPLFEEIGNGLCRLNLRKIQVSGLGLATANQFFLITAAQKHGTSAGFQAKLEILQRFLVEQSWPEALNELIDFVKTYDFQKCPPFSHSAAYRQSFAPSYRIVKDEFRDAFAVFVRLDSLLKTKHHAVAAIDGMCGAGKSTLAALVQKVYDSTVIPMDHFFLPARLRTPERLQEAGGNVDYDRFAREIMPRLKDNLAIQYRPYDCARQAPGRLRTLQPGRLCLVEGSYSLHPKFQSLYDLKIFMQVSPEEQIRRIRRRNNAEMQKRFFEEWIPMEERYFSVMQTARQSDLLVQLA